MDKISQNTVRLCSFDASFDYISFLGLDRSAFDNKVVSFDEHINSEHNMGHYLYFTVLLKVKDTTEFTGPESYVSQMIKVRHECKDDSLRGRVREVRYRVG